MSDRRPAAEAQAIAADLIALAARIRALADHYSAPRVAALFDEPADNLETARVDLPHYLGLADEREAEDEREFRAATLADRRYDERRDMPA